MSFGEPVAALLAALSLLVLFVVALSGLARTAQRMVGNDPILIANLTRCAACAGRAVCETGVLAAGCPNLREPPAP